MGVLLRPDAEPFYITVAAVAPAEIPAGESADTVLTHADVQANDLLYPIPPANLNAGLAPVGCHTATAGGFSLRIANGTAGAVTPTPATWGFIVYRR